MMHRELKSYAKKAVGGDEEALEMVVLLAPAGTLGEMSPEDYAKAVDDGEILDDEDSDHGCYPMSEGGRIPYDVEEDLRAFERVEQVKADPERLRKVQVALDKKERELMKARGQVGKAE